MKKDNTVRDGCLALTMLPIILVVSYIVNGLVLMILWDWFIVPQFEWATSLSLPYAIGLALVVGFLTYQEINTKPSSTSVEEAVIKAFAKTFVHAIFALLIGFIVMSFI